MTTTVTPSFGYTAPRQFHLQAERRVAATPHSSVRTRLATAIGVVSIAATAVLGIAALSFADNSAPAGPAVVSPAAHQSTVLGRGNLPVMHMPTARAGALPAKPLPAPQLRG
jgi:hypothetical protein